jgi:hypothetical protein
MSNPTDPIAAVRMAWAAAHWRLDIDNDGGYIASARIVQTTAGDLVLLDLDEPTTDELTLLRLLDRAPADIGTLLAEIERLTIALNQAAQMKSIVGARRIVADAIGGTGSVSAFWQELQKLRKVRAVASIAIDAWGDIEDPLPIDVDLSALAVAIRESEEDTP